MPRVSAFYGIVIWMYPNEGHHGRPHFHAEYGESEASFDIETLEVIIGQFAGTPDPLGREVGQAASARATRQLSASPRW